jgi:hypothetical protein
VSLSRPARDLTRDGPAPAAPAAAREPRIVVAYACALLAVAIAALVAAAGSGAALPALGICLLLAVPVAICMNRFVLFTNEVGATAEAAVLFAALVLFRDDAVVLGPLVIALLVGPLDANHWERRSFVRMAYNSGSQALTTLVCVAVFVPLSDGFGSSWPGVTAAAAVAVLPYILVETAFGVTLVVLRGERTGPAVRHQLPVNALALVLALYGAGVALLVPAVGWWCVPVLLVPVAFVPELTFALLRTRRWSGPRPWSTAVVVAATVLGAIALASAIPVADVGTLGALLVIAVLIGLELRAGPDVLVPPMVAVGVLAAVVLFGGGAAYGAAVLTACCTTLVALGWRATRALRPLLLAATSAVVCVWIFDLVDVARGGVYRGVVSAAVAGSACAAVIVLFGARDRERGLIRVAWSVPVLLVAAALAIAWADVGHLGAVVFGSGLLFVSVSMATWGAPPWRSRFLSRLGTRRVASGAWLVFGAGAACAIGCSIAAICTVGSSRAVMTTLALGSGEATVGMVAAGVRQWRFAPSHRRVDALVLTVAAATLLVLFPMASVDEGPGCLAVMCIALIAVTTVGRGALPRSTSKTCTSDDRCSAPGGGTDSCAPVESDPARVPREAVARHR